MSNGPSRRALLAAVPALVLAACRAASRSTSQSVGRPTRPTPSSTEPAGLVPPAGSAPPSTTAGAALGSFVSHGPASRQQVALTFHGSGDVGLLDQLLAVAAGHHAPLTIFAVGQWLDANPGVAGRIAAGGHEL